MWNHRLPVYKSTVLFIYHSCPISATRGCWKGVDKVGPERGNIFKSVMSLFPYNTQRFHWASYSWVLSALATLLQSMAAYVVSLSIVTLAQNPEVRLKYQHFTGLSPPASVSWCWQRVWYITSHAIICIFFSPQRRVSVSRLTINDIPTYNKGLGSLSKNLELNLM